MSHDAAVATFEKLYADLAKAQSYVQLRVQILAKWKALPDNEAKQLLVEVAVAELKRAQDSQANTLLKIKEAEIREAEQTLAGARWPTDIAAAHAEIERLRVQRALVRAMLANADDADCQA